MVFKSPRAAAMVVPVQATNATGINSFVVVTKFVNENVLWDQYAELPGGFMLLHNKKASFHA